MNLTLADIRSRLTAIPASLREQTIVIELYTRKIDVNLETAVEKQFADFDLEKSESWIEDSKEYQIRYSFTNYLK